MYDLVENPLDRFFRDGVLARLHGCAGLSDPLLITYAQSTIFSLTCLSAESVNQYYDFTFKGCPNRQLVAQHVRSAVHCYECGKPRCIYSKKSLTTREERALRRLTEKFQYTCGSVITPDGKENIKLLGIP